MKKYIFLLVTVLSLALVSCKSDPKTASTTDETTQTIENQETKTPEIAGIPEITTDEKPVLPNAGDFKLSGVLGDATENSSIEILQIPYDNSKPRSFSREVVKADGSFEVNIKHPGKGVYSLKLGKDQLLFLLDGSEDEVILNVAKGGFRTLNVDVKGADDNRRYFAVMKGVANKTMNSEALVEMIKMEKNPLLASLIALQVLKDISFVDLHRSVQKKLAKDKLVNKKRYIDAYNNYVSSMESQVNQAVIKVGAMAPDLAYKNPEGKIMKLSDLHGKLVLLDFWASWCAPCRRANPGVVQVYNQYKDKGFTVFSVSLDGDRRGSTDPKVIKMHHDKWVNAIAKDGLAWPNHVSDLKSWNSEASAKYGVTTIPATFLIGRDGKILEINPRHNLEDAVKKHL